MRFSYECTECGNNTQHDGNHVAIGEPHETPCGVCGGRVRRIATFAYKRPMGEHYNIGLGRYIRDESHFRSELRRASDRQSELTGHDHNYVQVDYHEKEALGVTDEGLDETAKARHDAEHQA